MRRHHCQILMPSIRRLCYGESCQANRKKTYIRDHIGNIIHKAQRHRPQPFSDASEHMAWGLVNKITRIIPAATSHIPKGGNASPRINVLARKNAVQSMQIHPTSASAVSDGNFRNARQEWAMDKCNAPKKKQNVAMTLASFNCGTRGLTVQPSLAKKGTGQNTPYDCAGT